METNSKYEVEAVRVTHRKGRPVSLYFRIRTSPWFKGACNVPNTWTNGILRLDMTRIYSASFQKWLDLTYHHDERVYKFNASDEDKDYTIIEELISLADQIVSDWYIFGIKHRSETTNRHKGKSHEQDTEKRIS